MLEQNLVFNAVRETNDHGPLNSWSRMGFLNIEASPTPSYAVLWNQVRHNMFVCGFSANQHGFAALDYDDGTEYMNSTHNVLAYSGFKACWHSNNQRYSGNLLVRPDLQAMNGNISPQPCASCTAGAPSPGSNRSGTNASASAPHTALARFIGCCPKTQNAKSAWPCCRRPGRHHHRGCRCQ